MHNSRLFRVLTLLISVLAVPAADAGDRETLETAFERSDSVVLKRAAIASRAGDLVAMLDTDVRRTILAAVIASPHVEDSPLVLAALARAAHSSDRSVALAAGRAAMAIVSRHNRTTIADLDVARGALGDALKTWHALARDDERWADLRVVALEISASLADILAGKPAKPIIELLDDSDPEIRAAAFELLPAPLPEAHVERVARAIAEDKSTFVALTAAVSLCDGLAFGDAPGVASALGERGKLALEKIVLDRDLPGPRRLEAARCLVKTDSKDTLAQLVKTLPGQLATQARALAREAK